MSGPFFAAAVKSPIRGARFESPDALPPSHATAPSPKTTNVYTVPWTGQLRDLETDFQAPSMSLYHGSGVARSRGPEAARKAHQGKESTPQEPRVTTGTGNQRTSQGPTESTQKSASIHYSCGKEVEHRILGQHLPPVKGSPQILFLTTGKSYVEVLSGSPALESLKILGKF